MYAEVDGMIKSLEELRRWLADGNWLEFEAHDNEITNIKTGIIMLLRSDVHEI